MNEKSTKETEAKPEELHDNDLDQAAGGYAEVEWTYAKSEGTGSGAKKIAEKDGILAEVDRRAK